MAAGTAEGAASLLVFVGVVAGLFLATELLRPNEKRDEPRAETPVDAYRAGMERVIGKTR